MFTLPLVRMAPPLLLVWYIPPHCLQPATLVETFIGGAHGQHSSGNGIHWHQGNRQWLGYKISAHIANISGYLFCHGTSKPKLYFTLCTVLPSQASNGATMVNMFYQASSATKSISVYTKTIWYIYSHWYILFNIYAMKQSATCI